MLLMISFGDCNVDMTRSSENYEQYYNDILFFHFKSLNFSNYFLYFSKFLPFFLWEVIQRENLILINQ